VRPERLLRGYAARPSLRYGTPPLRDVLRKHGGVRALFDNRWLYLFRLDAAGRIAARYTGDLTWTAITTSSPISNRLKVAS
jgi:hypothetical protein